MAFQPFRIIVIFFTLIVMGCSASLKVAPQFDPAPEPIEVIIQGNTDFHGNSKYLPRTFAQSNSSTTSLVLRYSYNDAQEHQNFISVSPFGAYPIAGEKQVVAKGLLEILKNGRSLRTFEAFAKISGHSEFLTETLSEMRQRALFAIRDSIESQMLQEKKALQKLGQFPQELREKI